MEIKQLFHSNKNIERSIEKVITYGAAQEARLKAEISEYVVTKNIEEQFYSLLNKMQIAMELGDSNEVGVWVSGFYGSGKSSFTKYLGFAFDDSIKIDNVPFIQHLQARFKEPKTKALLTAVAKRFPAAVLMLDLASEQVAGATMEEVSTVLYYKVLQWAGYSRNLKVAALERKLKKDNRYQEFLDLFAKETNGESWQDYLNDELTIDGLIPEIAHKLYPNLFRTPTSFNTETSEIIRFENDRVSEMIDIAKQATGKEYIIFIVDEVGQYVSSRSNLIQNLDGLSKNLKNLGNGKVWFIGTAQQTLTEDDPKATLNSPELYKLKDRFPIQIFLEANDIKEICYNRLLEKSTTGEQELGILFDKFGQQLRHNTKLIDARIFGADFDRTTFINLYPFLPAHFDILLQLLGSLAKSTGGIGLRSAIKVIQDILVDRSDNQIPIAEQQVGWLATTVTLFDSLEKDIRNAFQSLHNAVAKVKIRFPQSTLHQDIAKTVCVLQILGNLPISVQNIASLMHPTVTTPSLLDSIKKAIEELISDPIVPLGEQDNQIRFFSEKLNDIEQERALIPVRSMEIRRIQNEALKEVYSPLPSSNLGSLNVQTGLKTTSSSGISVSISGERNTIQTLVEIVVPTEYESTKTRLTDESRHKSAQFHIFLIGSYAPEMEELTHEIYRCREIVNKYRNEPDQEVKEYCKGQTDRANRLFLELHRLIKRTLTRGSFIFKGDVTAVESLKPDLLDAARQHLSVVASQVYDRYSEAPVRVNTDHAEKFLRIGNLNAMSSDSDPLGFVQHNAGRPSINTEHRALVSIRDMIDRQGSIEGKRLSEIFTDAPFGWSPDTLRYCIAAMLLAGELKLRVAGREVSVNGQQAIDALKTNNSFKSVGISLRDERPSMELLATAASRLTQLTGDSVIPLENEISKATSKLLPNLQHAYGPLAEKLRSLGLNGADRLESLTRDIKDILFNDASDAPNRLGAADSALFTNLKWAADLKQAFDFGVEDILRNVLDHIHDLDNFPDTGVTAKLKQELSEDINQIKDRLAHPHFYEFSSELEAALSRISYSVTNAVDALQAEQKKRIREAETMLSRLPEWNELTAQEQNTLLSHLEDLSIVFSKDMIGLKLLVKQEYHIQSEIQNFIKRVQLIGAQRVQDKLKVEQQEAQKRGHDKILRQLKPKKRLTSITDLDTLINELTMLRNELKYAQEFEVSIQLNESWEEN